MNTITSIPVSSMVKILEAVATSRIQASDEPKDDVEKGEVVRGIVTSPIARSLYSALVHLDKYRNEVAEVSRQVVESEIASICPNDINRMTDVLTLIDNREDALKALFWQAIYEEHPLSIGQSMCVRQGWQLVSAADNGDWPKDPLPFLDGKLAGRIASTIISCFDGSTAEVDEVKFGAVADGEEVIGKISDNRLKALADKIKQLRLEAATGMPEGFPRPSLEAIAGGTSDKWFDDNTERIVEWIRAQNFESLASYDAYRQCYYRFTSILNDVLWCCVRDTMIELGTAGIGLRNDWKIVKLKPSADRQLRLLGTTVIRIPTDSALGMILEQMSAK